MAFKQHKKYDEFQTGRRQRQDAKNIVFVLTDGKTHDLSAMKYLLRVMYCFISYCISRSLCTYN